MKPIYLGALLGALLIAAPAFASEPVAYLGTITLPTGATAQGTIPAGTANPLPSAMQYGASGVTAVSSAIASATVSSSFTPIAGRTFHLQLSGTAVATCYLTRKLDGSTWTPITVTADATTTTLYKFSYASSSLSEDIVESQDSVPYRLDCGSVLGSYTSGTLTAKFSQ